MTSSWSLFKAFSWPRFMRMNLLLGLELLAVVVTSLWTAIKGNFTTATLFYNLCAWAMLPLLVGFVMLAVTNEKTARATTYRLLPISDWKFYTLNLTASLVNMIYLWLMQAILFALTLVLGWSTLTTGFNMSAMFFNQFSLSSGFWQAIAGAFLVIILAMILVWSTISLIHFATNATAGFLPRFRQQFVNVIITIVVIYIAFRLASVLIGMVSYLSSQLVNQGNVSSVWTSILVMLAVILVEGVINTLVLQKWVEPTLN